MRLFLRITAVYLVFGMLFVTIFRDNPLPMIVEIATLMPQSVALFLEYGWWVLVPFLVIFAATPREAVLHRLPGAIVVAFVCGVFFLTFTIVKSSLTFGVPFYAGPLLADIDRMLHFGTDPWRIAHLASQWINADWAVMVYAALWFAPAMYFPVVLRLFDNDEVRIQRYDLLFAFVWIVLGNVAAMIFMSEGPVYFDRVNGGDQFAALLQSLEKSGVASSAAGNTQQFLWDMHAGSGLSAGSGISAFPSVHVAMVTVIAVYVAERIRLLLVPAALFVAIYQFLSVSLGWHYAIDGYASILAVLAMHRWLRRRNFVLGPQGTLTTTA